jgi:hypothetical protein
VSGKPKAGDLWKTAQRGWPPGYPLVQFPNAPLLLAIGGMVVAALTDDTVHDYAQATVYAGLTAWAWEELAAGDNAVRRLLGAGGLVYVVVRVGQALSS